MCIITGRDDGWRHLVARPEVGEGGLIIDWFLFCVYLILYINFWRAC